MDKLTVIGRPHFAGRQLNLSGKNLIQAGDRLRIYTPGGGGRDIAEKECNPLDSSLQSLIVRRLIALSAAKYAENKNERQKKLLNRLLDGFKGKLTSSKWAKIVQCSQDTASRDIQDLIDKKILYKLPGGGRSTGHDLRDNIE